MKVTIYSPNGDKLERSAGFIPTFSKSKVGGDSSAIGFFIGGDEYLAIEECEAGNGG